MNELYESFYIPVELLATRSHIIFNLNNICHTSTLSWQNQCRWRSLCALPTLMYTHKPMLPIKPDKCSTQLSCCKSCRLTPWHSFHLCWTSLHNDRLVVSSNKITCSTFSLSSWMDVQMWHISSVQHSVFHHQWRSKGSISQHLALWFLLACDRD